MGLGRNGFRERPFPRRGDRLSAGGLFFNRGRRTGRAFQKHLADRAREKRAKITQFADNLWNLGPDATTTAAARLSGVSQQTGSIYMRNMVAGLGWQAVCEARSDGKHYRCDKCGIRCPITRNPPCPRLP